MPETHFCESGHLGPLLILIMNFFLLNRSQVADQFNQLAMVEPHDPFQPGQLHRREIIAVADAFDGGLDTDLGQPLRIEGREALHAAVIVVNQLLSRLHAVAIQRLLKRIQG